jgi:hypothetical protein
MTSSEKDSLMKQYQAVIKVMEANGGFATLGFLNQKALKVEGCNWKTKTPFASIRRIVQDNRFFFRIRPGLWALKSYEDKLPPEILPPSEVTKEKQDEYGHTYYQGLLVEVGNFKRYQTFVPNQDKNKFFLGKKLSEVTSIPDIYKFSFDHIVGTTKTIDVVWFNERNMPTSAFEVEHSTAISNSLLKFVELQDFAINFCIVADNARTKEFHTKLRLDAFRPISNRVKFWSYDDVAELHSRTSELASIAQKLNI